MLKRIAHNIRHSALLEKQEWLWNFLRQPYYLLINFRNNGVKLKVNENLIVRLSPEYYNTNIINYEVKSVNKLLEWIKQNPNNYILDIGCSVGYISLFALFSSNKTKVIAFDSDLSSLKATENMCKYAEGNRINLVYGLISDENSSALNIYDAILNTNNKLLDKKITGLPGTTKYINLDQKDNTEIPIYSLDNLFKDFNFQTSKLLIKCDVEGAELFVLNGATNFINKYKPQILLSVHPQIISTYNHTIVQIEDKLEQLDYKKDILDIDHEEHWWCTYNLN